MIHGNDTDATMLGISAMNLLLHDMKTPKLKRIDSLSTDYSEENDYTLVLANHRLREVLMNLYFLIL